MKSIYLITAERKPAGILDFVGGAFEVRLAAEHLSSKEELESLLNNALRNGVTVRKTEHEAGKILEVAAKVGADDPGFVSAVKDAINAARIGTPRLFALVRPEAQDGKGGAR